MLRKTFNKRLLSHLFPPCLFALCCRSIRQAWLALLSLVFFTAATAAKLPEKDIAEQELIDIFNKIEQNHIDQAINKSKTLIQQYPQFQLAKLVYADLLNSRSGQQVQISKADFQPLLQEARARLQAKQVIAEIQGKIPQNLVRIAPATRFILQFDLSLSRLYLFENNNQQIKLLNSYYISQGKQGYGKQKEGDNKTPIGIYQFTHYLKDEQLPELYGWGAFPINYPNTWDRLQGKTGHGIWLHGIPRNNYSRPPKDSEGCVVLSNQSLAQLKKLIRFYQTPVILSQKIHWISPQQYQQQQQFFSKLIGNWVEAWQSRSVEQYLAFYSPKFNNRKKDYQAWAKHKSRVIRQAKKIHITLSDLSVYRYPNKPDLLYVRFYQQYSSNVYQGSLWKEQYWQKEADGQWRIIYEGKG